MSADALCSVYSYTHTLSATAYILRIFACIIVYFAYISSVYFGTLVKAVKFLVKSKSGTIHSKVLGTGRKYINAQPEMKLFSSSYGIFFLQWRNLSLHFSLGILKYSSTSEKIYQITESNFNPSQESNKIIF